MEIRKRITSVRLTEGDHRSLERLAKAWDMKLGTALRRAMHEAVERVDGMRQDRAVERYVANRVPDHVPRPVRESRAEREPEEVYVQPTSVRTNVTQPVIEPRVELDDGRTVPRLVGRALSDLGKMNGPMARLLAKQNRTDGDFDGEGF